MFNIRCRAAVTRKKVAHSVIPIDRHGSWKWRRKTDVFIRHVGSLKALLVGPKPYTPGSLHSVRWATEARAGWD